MEACGDSLIAIVVPDIEVMDFLIEVLCDLFAGEVKGKCDFTIVFADFSFGYVIGLLVQWIPEVEGCGLEAGLPA